MYMYLDYSFIINFKYVINLEMIYSAADEIWISNSLNSQYDSLEISLN